MNIWELRHGFLALGLICLITACNDDDCPTCPDPQTPPRPTLGNIWPNEDGNAWTYDLTSTLFIVPFNPNPEDPPPMPSLEDLHADLQVPVEGEIESSALGLFRLAFDGLITTHSGVTAQNLVPTVYVDPWDEKSTSMEGPSASAGSTYTADGFELLLQRIAQARPDLRSKIAARYGVVWESQEPRDKSEVPTFPLFLYGYAWSKETSGIFGYGDVDTDHSWIFLEADLSVGHAFQMQLIPMLSDDIFLYGQIWSRGSFTAGGLEFANCVECMYAIDMGIQEATDENGNVVDRFRSWSYGVIVYAPAVGPVYSHERLLTGPRIIFQEENGHLEENVVDYVGATRGDS